MTRPYPVVADIANRKRCERAEERPDVAQVWIEDRFPMRRPLGDPDENLTNSEFGNHAALPGHTDRSWCASFAVHDELPQRQLVQPFEYVGDLGLGILSERETWAE